MLHSQFGLILAQNRRLERNLASFSHLGIPQRSLYECTIDGILQICDSEGLKKSTKYLVKKSIDTFVVSNPNFGVDELRRAAIVFLCMVVKLNQDPRLYEKLTIKCYLQEMESGANPTQYKEFVNFECQLYSLPQFNINFTTPYDYVHLYKEMFLLDEKLVAQLINILDLSYTISELMFNSAEELFVGCLVMIWQEKKEIRKQWLLNLTLNQQQSLKVAQIISQVYHYELELANQDITNSQ